MKLYSLLSEKKSAILKRWYDAILSTYPPDTSRFLKGQKNPLLNPVGSTIFQGIENLFEELLKEDMSRASLFLDNIIRIRAVQDFTPSQCINSILFLKKVIKEELKKELVEHRLLEELLTLESRIDDMTLLAFDIYMKCREKLYQLRVNELQNLTFRRLQKADQMYKQERDIKDSKKATLERKEVAP